VRKERIIESLLTILQISMALIAQKEPTSGAQR
jgi:hypothetical protein